ncbi:helix-turn-helix domain-containing protein [Streptomyces sennicomposti]
MEFGDAMEAGWDDEESAAVLRTVGRIIKKFRERAGLTQAELGAAIGYSEEQVSSVERGRRAPKGQFLLDADRVLDAGGVIAELKKDVEEARYPKKVRDLRKLEGEAVEICAYDNSVINGLLQTEAYLRAVFASRRPAFSEEEMERLVAARLARQSVLNSTHGLPAFSFILDEAVLRRCVGGKMVLRRQLERMLDVGQMRNVEVQVLPLDQEDNAGLGGPFHLLRLKEGTTVVYNEVQRLSRLISEPKEVQLLELRYGIIRAQALPPRKSLALIKKVLGET